MSDLISRAAAIETVRKAQSIGQAHRMLLQLPSAQPGWIPTSERIPDNDRAVLVTLKWAEDDYEVAVGEYWHNSTASHGWGSFEGHVIAWHELPTPYREGGQDNG